MGTQLGKAALSREKPNNMLPTQGVFQVTRHVFWYPLNTIRVLVMMVNYLQKDITTNFEARKVIENVPMSVQFLKRQCVSYLFGR